MKRLTDKSFVYADAAESSKPGYLQRKFDRIRAEMKKAAEKPSNVATMKRKEKANG